MGQTSASITAPSHGGDDPRPRPCVRPRPTHVESHRRPLRIPTMRRAQPRLANIRVSNRRHRRGCAGPAPGPTAADTKVRACPCATLGQPPARLAGALHRSGRLGRGIGFFRRVEGVGEKNPSERRGSGGGGGGRRGGGEKGGVGERGGGGAGRSGEERGRSEKRAVGERASAAGGETRVRQADSR